MGLLAEHHFIKPYQHTNDLPDTEPLIFNGHLNPKPNMLRELKGSSRCRRGPYKQTTIQK